MSDCTPRERRILDSLLHGRSNSVIKSYWLSQLRPLTMQQGIQSKHHVSPDRTVGCTSAHRTPSTANSGCLTDSAGRLSTDVHSSARSGSGSGSLFGASPSSGSSSSSRRLHLAAESARRRRASGLKHRLDSVAKPLFQSFLLPQFEAHETCPLLTVVFDLDETLVSNRHAHLSSAILRPYALHVLNALRYMKGIEVVLWTASTKETATPVVAQLNESNIVFDEVIFRNDLWFTEPLHTKDLRLLGRDMDRLVIIENAANCCKLNPQNAVLVDDFYGMRHTDDATLINVYYIIERLLKKCREDVPVKDTLKQLSTEGHLCSSLVLSLPEAWKGLPLREIAPLKIPPYGRFTQANRKPVGQSIMHYWTM